MVRLAGWALFLALVLAPFPCRAGGGPGGQPPATRPPKSEAEPAVAGPGQRPAPETLVLGSLVEIYGPVDFAHQAHAGYAGEECSRCHHHQKAEEPFRPCNSCHQRRLFQAADQLNRPGVVGAYHRQCINCHVEMGSGPTGCTDCHQPRD